MIIDFIQAKSKKENTRSMLEEQAIQLLIIKTEITFWIHMLSYLTHSLGYAIQHEKNKRELKLLQKEYHVLQDLTEKMLVFNGFNENESTEEGIQFYLTYEEMIILEGQLELFRDICEHKQDREYMEITEKYLQTFYQVLEGQAEIVDGMTNLMIKLALDKQ
ncbi:hypothetical protein [Bacillus sp. AK128]